MDHGQCRIGLASLDAAHVGAKQTAARGQVFLRQARSLAQVADALAKRSFFGALTPRVNNAR